MMMMMMMQKNGMDFVGEEAITGVECIQQFPRIFEN